MIKNSGRTASSPAQVVSPFCPPWLHFARLSWLSSQLLGVALIHPGHVRLLRKAFWTAWVSKLPVSAAILSHLASVSHQYKAGGFSSLPRLVCNQPTITFTEGLILLVCSSAWTNSSGLDYYSVYSYYSVYELLKKIILGFPNCIPNPQILCSFKVLYKINYSNY